MQFKIHTYYAIRTLRFVHMRGGETLTAMQVAIAVGTTTPIIVKIAARLKKAGMLKTIQGGQGGYILGKPVSEISIYDVFVCIEGELRINHYVKSGEVCSQDEQAECKMHEVLYSLEDDLIKKLSSVFISDLV